MLLQTGYFTRGIYCNFHTNDYSQSIFLSEINYKWFWCEKKFSNVKYDESIYDVIHEKVNLCRKTKFCATAKKRQ